MVSLRVIFLASCVASLFVSVVSAAEDPWRLLSPGECGALKVAEDAAQEFGFAVGDVVSFADLAKLRPFLPPEVWEHRDLLFFEGMRLEIGPCSRDYAPPSFFREVTQNLAGQAKLLSNGGIENAKAGLPFPPDTIGRDDSDAGQKWAWNIDRRWRGGGRFGELRLSYLLDGAATASLVGESFVAQLMNRADLADSDYRLPWARKAVWVAGAKTRDPSTGRRCAYRQYRKPESDAEPLIGDDVFFHSSATRKVERVDWDLEAPLLACAYERGWRHRRGGKPGRYRWRVAGVHNLLAPINARAPAYPVDPDRSFGRGTSLANDRWELRRVLVLETTDDAGGSQSGEPLLRRYVDLQTLVPLYLVENNGGARGLFQYAGRWSGDRPDYPDPEMRVIDPAVQIYIDARGSEAVRIETWETVAAPEKPRLLQRLTSTATLSKGR